MDLDQGIDWINSEFTGNVKKNARHYRTGLGTEVSKVKKGAHDSVSDKIVRNLMG